MGMDVQISRRVRVELIHVVTVGNFTLAIFTLTTISLTAKLNHDN